MLPAAARMRRRGEFSATVRGGRRAGGPTLVVHLRRSPGATPHVGFVVPRTVGGAVVRNAVRRRLRHLCRARLAGLPADAQLVVRVLPPAAAADSGALGRDLDRALSRLLEPTGGRS